MQWIKAWLRNWLGVDRLADRCSVDTAEFIRTRDLLTGEVVKLGVRVENLREHYASVKEMGDACMARLDRETMKLATAIVDLEKRTGDSGMELAAAIDENRVAIQSIRVEFIEFVKLADADQKRISELEILVKDATIDTALAALEDRVARLESIPSPAPAQNGRRGGASWNSHQVAAGQGAALANGSPVPIPTPGVS